MFLENIVMDAVEPQRLGRFWEAALGCERLTDEPDAYETRLAVDGGPVLDLCFQRVAGSRPGPPRVHLDLSGSDQQADEVERLLALGATHLDIGQGDESSRVVLGDAGGNPFCVVEQRAGGTGPLAAIRLDSADADRDAAFWSWLTGWTTAAGAAPRALRHPSRRGPLLELCPERAPKGDDKNRLHLDVRLEVDDDADAVAAAVVERGGRELHPDWGDLPWRLFTDPSGNEFCVLPAPS